MSKAKHRKLGNEKHLNGSSQCYIIGWDKSLGKDKSCILYGYIYKNTKTFYVKKERWV